MAREPTQRTDAMLPHPALKAILLCDRIIQEAETSKVTLVGILDRLTASEFPFDYVRGLELYVRVTDAAGEYTTRMEVVRVEDEQTIVEGDATMAMLDRTRSYEIRFDFPRVPFERPGQYEFRLFANGRFVGAAVLLVEGAE